MNEYEVVKILSSQLKTTRMGLNLAQPLSWCLPADGVLTHLRFQNQGVVKTFSSQPNET